MKKTQTVGVIVGRFQTPFLHEAHKSLIETVINCHEKVIIFLGLSQLRVSKNNPLDFQAREQMLKEQYPEVIVLYVKDTRCDKAWSKALDIAILDTIGANQDALLYGSRDSFIPYYSGKFKTKELDSNVFVSATEIREKAHACAKNSPDFRAGVIWATGNSYPTTITTVDIAIFNENSGFKEILLGKKTNEHKLRFIGGFSDPKSSSFEADARREVFEETGLEISEPKYVGSFLIDDWRYRKEPNKIKTILFVANKVYGREVPQDDINSLHWVDFDKLTENDFVEEHKVLFHALTNKFKKLDERFD